MSYVSVPGVYFTCRLLETDRRNSCSSSGLAVKRGLGYSNKASYVFFLGLLFNTFPKPGELPALRSWGTPSSGSSIFLVKSE